MTLDEIITQRKLSRRRFLQAGGACLTTMLVPFSLYGQTLTPVRFAEISKNTDNQPRVPQGYGVQTLISWGDALDGAPTVLPGGLTPGEQSKRFGYNNDYIAYMPLPWGSKNSRHGLLHVNHEYPNPEVMTPPVMMQSLGWSTLEVRRSERGWEVVKNSPYNRRVTTTTLMDITGPAAGHRRMQTTADPSGTKVIGTFANCAGGVTPWGTVLSAEENFDGYFSNPPKDSAYNAHYARYRVNHGNDGFGFAKVDERFDISKHPYESNRFGWVVEYDPYNPLRPPAKRTALGRFKHECANTTLAPDGRVVVYSGDDEKFEYLYRFVSSKPYNPKNRDANWGLLDEGLLSVAQFQPDGTLHWIPLVYGEGELTEQNGFYSQGDVLIAARRAGDVVKATPMDRPEDVEVNPVNRLLYVALTNNNSRTPNQVNPPNRRADNKFGHILELIPPGGNHTAEIFRWEIFLEAGDPADPTHDAHYLKSPSRNGWLTNPDNLAFDRAGNMWLATDGQTDKAGTNDGVYVIPCAGSERGRSRLFMTVPKGAEATGPCHTPDGTSFFLSIQHPGDKNDSSGWPDFTSDIPPRPSVVVVTKDDGGVVGS